MSSSGSISSADEEDEDKEGGVGDVGCKLSGGGAASVLGSTFLKLAILALNKH